VTEVQAAIKALVVLLEDYVQEHRRPGGGYDLPEGLYLEMHPRVHYVIRANWQPGYGDFVSGRESPMPAQIPVKINPDLPDGYWRLAVITVDVINGGVMP
jgi:hypothetical protein